MRPLNEPQNHRHTIMFGIKTTALNYCKIVFPFFFVRKKKKKQTTIGGEGALGSLSRLAH